MEKNIPSILTSIKKLLGIAEEYQVYDADLIMHINSVFSILTQLGVGPADGFSTIPLALPFPGSQSTFS